MKIKTLKTKTRNIIKIKFNFFEIFFQMLWNYKFIFYLYCAQKKKN